MTDAVNLVAFIDDDPDVRRANETVLKLADLDVRTFASAEEALQTLDNSFAGVVVSDLRMPRVDGRECFRRLRTIDADIPIVFITGHADIAEAVEIMREGAYDFIPKPFSSERLISSVRRALEKRALILENRRLRNAAAAAGAQSMIIGESGAMAALRATVRQIADADVDVLIEGETGVGKELVARALHMEGARRHKPFVAINCGAITETAIEPELFGHEAGTYQNALRRRVGRIEMAERGTLYLDDVDQASPALQNRLVRIVEDREIIPAGSSEPKPVQFRAVASSKLDLATLVEEGGFRRDLYYRLNVIRIHVPPLRERRSDIPVLFGHFLSEAARKFRREIPTISDSIRRRVLENDWPGNVRELQNFAERVALGFENNTENGRTTARLSLPQRLERFEDSVIREVLTTCEGDIRLAVEHLGVPRNTLYDKLRRHGIDIDRFRKHS